MRILLISACLACRGSVGRTVHPDPSTVPAAECVCSVPVDLPMTVCALPELPYDGIDNDCEPATPDDDLDRDGLLLTSDCDAADASIGAVTPDGIVRYYSGEVGPEHLPFVTT